MKMFLDREKTLSTCKESSCDGCSVSGSLVCHFGGKNLALFILMILPVGGLAGYALYGFNPWFLAAWIAFMFAYFGFIEIRVMCSHCPHYAEPGLKSLKCWANYGSPKLWKYRPGPMSLMEKTVFLIGLALIFLLPPVVLLIEKSFVLLGIYILLLIGWKIALRQLFCRRCMNFACPLNAVGEKERQKFFERNPVVKDAWSK